MPRNLKNIDRAKELRTNQTKAEAVLWQVLRGKTVKRIKFRRQHPVDEFILDFFAPSLNLAVEIDGDTHTGDTAQDYDEERTEKLMKYGIDVIRFSNEEVLGNVNGVIEAILLWIEGYKQN